MKNSDNRVYVRKTLNVKSIIGTPEYVNIGFNGTIYTRLMGVHARDYGGKKFFYIIIVSTGGQSMPRWTDEFIERVEPLYNRLYDRNMSTREKIHTMKHMIWHMAHTMILIRGSAAASEIGIEGLCEAHKIKYTYPANAIPLDLVALFSPDPETFANSVVISDENELAEKNSIPTPAYQPGK